MLLFQPALPAPNAFPMLLLWDPRVRSPFIPDEPILGRLDRACVPCISLRSGLPSLYPSLTLCTLVAFAAMVEAIPQVDRQSDDSQVCTRAAGGYVGGVRGVVTK